jgi:hypothetical protein
MEEINTFYNFGEDGESDNDQSDNEQREENYGDMDGEFEVDLELDERLGDTTINSDLGFGMEVCHLSFIGC